MFLRTSAQPSSLSTKRTHTPAHAQYTLTQESDKEKTHRITRKQQYLAFKKSMKKKQQQKQKNKTIFNENKMDTKPEISLSLSPLPAPCVCMPNADC